MGNNQSCGFGVANNTKHYITAALSMAGTHYYENMIAPGEVFYRWPGAVWYTVYVYPTKILGEMTDGQCALEIIQMPTRSTDFAKVLGIDGTDAAHHIVRACKSLTYYGTSVAAGIGLVDTAIALIMDIFSSLGWQLSLEEAYYLGQFYNIQPGRTEAEITDALESLRRDLFEVYSGKHLYAERMGCYGGGRGTWLEVTGLPEITLKGGELQYVGQEIQLQLREFDYFKAQMDLRSFSNGQWKFTRYSEGKYRNGLKL